MFRLFLLAGTFSTSLVVANILAVKIMQVGPWAIPAGVVAYPVTFLITDLVSELYGKRAATSLVWAGALVAGGATALVFIAMEAPPAAFWPNQDSFETVLGSVPRIMAASLVAFLLSQQYDVIAFHFLGRLTRGRHLWLRNNGSTIVSQAIDTVAFALIAFAGVFGLTQLLSIMISQYAVKVLIALGDTPVLYALVRLMQPPQSSQLAAGEAA